MSLLQYIAVDGAAWCPDPVADHYNVKNVGANTFSSIHPYMHTVRLFSGTTKQSRRQQRHSLWPTRAAAPSVK